MLMLMLRCGGQGGKRLLRAFSSHLGEHREIRRRDGNRRATVFTILYRVGR